MLINTGSTKTVKIKLNRFFNTKDMLSTDVESRILELYRTPLVYDRLQVKRESTNSIILFVDFNYRDSAGRTVSVGVHLQSVTVGEQYSKGVAALDKKLRGIWERSQYTEIAPLVHAFIGGNNECKNISRVTASVTRDIRRQFGIVDGKVSYKSKD